MKDNRLAALGRTMLEAAANGAPTQPRRRSAKRSATPPTPPAAAAARRCPVGWCVPTTGEAATIGSGELLCERHWLKLSGPLLKQLRGAHGRNAPDLQSLLREAVIEARRHDRHWRPFGVAWRWVKDRWWHRDDRGSGRVLESFFAERDALLRATCLDEQLGKFVREVCLLRTISQPSALLPWHGQRWTSVAIRVLVAHEALASDNTVIAQGPTLASAITKARAAGHWFPAALRNRITGRRLTLEQARALLERERSAACSG